MKKITFIINDYEYFKKLYEKQTTPEHLEKILEDVQPFKAVFTVYGRPENHTPDRYALTTENRENLNINDLNGYQKGCVIGDCYRYFEGKRDFEGGTPCGVVEIKEEDVQV